MELKKQLVGRGQIQLLHDSGQGGLFKQDNEISSPIKGSEFLHKLSDY